jgi:hypothetical protein
MSCPTCRIEQLQLRAPRIEKRFLAITRRMSKPQIVCFYPSFGHEFDGDGMLSAAQKLKDSLHKKGLLNSKLFIAVNEYSESELLHLHLVIDSHAAGCDILDAIRDWNSNPKNKLIGIVAESTLDIEVCTAEWAANYLSKQWRCAESFPLLAHVDPRARRFSASPGVKRRRKRKSARSKGKTSQQPTQLQQQFQGMRATNNLQPASSRPISSQPAGCAISNQTLIQVMDRSGTFVSDSAPILIEFHAALFALGKGPAFVRNPHRTRFKLTLKDNITLWQLTEAARAAGKSHVTARDVMPPVVAKVFERVRALSAERRTVDGRVARTKWE